MNRRTLVLAAALVTAMATAIPAASAVPEPSSSAGAKPADKRAAELEPAEVTPVEKLDRGRDSALIAKAAEAGTYLIRLVEPPVPTYEGHDPDFARTAPRPGEGLDPDSAAVRAYRGHLAGEQADLVDRVEEVLEREVEVPFTYQYAVNGIAAVLSAEEAAVVASDRAVAAVTPDVERELHTDAGPEWIGADVLWDAMAELGLPTDVKGEGIVIGTIDTGISPGNRSFAEVGDDGYAHTNPRGPGNYLGVCDPDNPEPAGGFDPDFPCNEKLIGAYVFGGANDSALDYDGHGSHTASTSGGNVVEDVVIDAPTLTTDPVDISGVAPHANVVSYLGCCTVSGLTQSIEQAILDEVDVINYSIGSAAPSPNLWEDFDTRGFLNARAAGIFVATSAGNAGPGFATIGSPSDAPWITSVGASTHNRHVGNAIVDLTSSEGDLPEIAGKSLTGPLPAAPIVYAADFDVLPGLPPTDGDPAALCGAGTLEDPVNPFPPGTFNGEIVICDRGVFARVDKAVHLLEAGAGGIVHVNDEPSGDSLNADAFVIPGVHISFDDGEVFKDWLDNGADDHTGAVRGTTFEVDDGFGDVMAAFSSRGPNRSVDTISPDVTAPGVDILAAVGAGSYDVDIHGLISGTSMSSPHVAGAGALMSQARPDWTPAQMQSALMTTGRDILNHDGTPADPYAQGAGHINVDNAAMAGLLFDETFENYLASNPAEGGDPKTLNLPSFANTECLVECSWDRTATVPASDHIPADVTWSASTEADAGLELAVSLSGGGTVSPGESLDMTVTADVTGAPVGETLFGEVTLTPSAADIPAVTMPVAVAPSTGVLPDAVAIDTRRDAGSHLVEDIESIEVTDFTGTVNGLVRGTVEDSALVQDATNGDPYDDLSQVDVYLVEVPDGTSRLVAESIEAEMPDLDLFVGTGEVPSAATQVCSSTTPTAQESCDIADPEPGTWWIVVQNWQGTDPDTADAYTLAHAVVPGEASGNAGIAGPDGTVPAQEPYDIRIHWDVPEMAPGDRWYGTAVLGSSPSTPGDIGSFPVTVVRHDDDVTKTASVAEAGTGDTVGYEIAVQPNVTAADLTYTVTDTVPDGLTIDPDSVTGGGVVDGQTITWEVELPRPGFTYDMVTSAEDAACAVPLSGEDNSGSGGYLNLVDFGITPNPDIVGDDFWFTAFAAGAPFQYWGNTYQGIDFVPSGIAFFGSTPGEEFFEPQQIPDAADPNNTLAMLWQDFEVAWGDDPHRGVSLASLGGTGADGGIVIDYKGVEPSPAGSTGERYDFQVFMWRSAGEGYDIIFAYDNLGDLESLTTTVGLEDALGTDAVALLNREAGSGVLSDGFAVCFDFAAADGDPVVLAYEVTVDADATSGDYTNEAVHSTDDPFAVPATATATVEVDGNGGADVSFESLRELVSALAADGDVTRQGANRLGNLVDQAERFYNRGRTDQAIKRLEEFQDLAADPKLVTSGSARDVLIAEADRLIAQIQASSVD